MQHGAAVAERPGAGIAGRLLADEAVFDHQAVVGERVLVEEVSELAVEALVLVVADLEQAVFDAEGVAEVVAEIVLGDLRRPAFEVLAVEQDDPVFLVRVRIRRPGVCAMAGSASEASSAPSAQSFSAHVHSCLCEGA